MTDEEKLAKEYAEGMAMYYESVHGSVPSQFEKYLKKAYLAGLKAGRPQWSIIAWCEYQNTRREKKNDD